MIRPRTQLSDQIRSCSFTIDLYPPQVVRFRRAVWSAGTPSECFRAACICWLWITNLSTWSRCNKGCWETTAACRLTCAESPTGSSPEVTSEFLLLFFYCCYSCYTSHRRLRHVMQHRANMHIFTCHQSTFIFLFLFNSSHDVPSVCVLCCGSKWFLQTFWDLWKQSWTVTLRMIYLYFASGLDRKHHTNIIVIIMYYPDTVSPFAFSIRYTGGKFNFISCRPLWSKLRTKYWQKQGAVCRHWVQQTVNKAN